MPQQFDGGPPMGDGSEMSERQPSMSDAYGGNQPNMGEPYGSIASSIVGK